MLYFAYGSNMDSVQMKERCPSSTFVCRAKLPWGVVYELLEHELEHLDKSEDFRPGRPDDQNEYTRENHYVWREGDAKRPLLVSLYRGHPQPHPPLPDCDYKKLIVEGARYWKLPVDYIQELESIQTA
jgi:hypothetical protein